MSSSNILITVMHNHALSALLDQYGLSEDPLHSALEELRPRDFQDLDNAVDIASRSWDAEKAGVDELSRVQFDLRLHNLRMDILEVASALGVRCTYKVPQPPSPHSDGTSENPINLDGTFS
ncbi:uncharacterized protein KD926_007459 [Aspergillus affinis]|uniref:uncharacterized protein n=1 Tax=Aspergillus affinis TaxID=1070780 RepID=UPI0022FEBC42|nr:uncharacterized protein KD926_007459 [Aspergillus affinis]KAI9041043.1 hypothetical protein KD926_007459 [Aspergillus affinis]